MMSKEDHLDAVVRYVEKHWFMGQNLTQIRIDATHSVSRKHQVAPQTVYAACMGATGSRGVMEFDHWLESRLRKRPPLPPSPQPTPAQGEDKDDEMTQLQRIEAMLNQVVENQQKTNARLERIEMLAERTDKRFYILAQGFLQVARDLVEVP